jgi:hypothetical protein
MSRFRSYSAAVVCVTCAVIVAGCITAPSQVNSFELRSHKYPTMIYGPFKYADGTEVLIGKSSFTMVVDVELVQKCSFKLKSHKYPDRIYGPFRCRPKEEVVIGKSSFTISATY